jgi:two-component system, NarL family, nitrate/nitrite response regulator NarL
MSTATILIVDDHPMMRTALRIALENQADLKVVGEAGSVAQGKLVAIALKPDLILLDLYLPDGNGVELIHFRNENLTETRILVVTSSSNEKDLIAAMEAGAESYLVKDSSTEQLLQGVMAVLGGMSFLTPGATGILLKKLRQPETEPGVDGSNLSEREKQILHHLARGATNTEIAKALFITESTVRTHFQRISKKLNLLNHSQMMLYAINNFK